LVFVLAVALLVAKLKVLRLVPSSTAPQTLSVWQHKLLEKVILLWVLFIVAYVLDLADFSRYVEKVILRVCEVLIFPLAIFIN
jgi:hypothetical protein